VNVLVLGASGRTGALIVSEVFRQGHEASALTRHPKNVRSHAGRVRIFKGDIFDEGALDLAMARQHAVIYALGMRKFFGPVKFYSESTRLVLAAMQRHNTKRLVCITALGVGESRGCGDWLHERLLAPILLRNTLADKTAQEKLIRDSDREWVIVRPARLYDGLPTRAYAVIAIPQPGDRASRICRADVAEFCVAQLASDEFLRCTPLLSH